MNRGPWQTGGVTDRPGADGVDPDSVPSNPVPPRSPTAEAVGRAMMGLGDIIEGKPPRDTYEYVLVVDDESGEPDDPDDPNHVVIEI
jgi:hypothetical protein